MTSSFSRLLPIQIKSLNKLLSATLLFHPSLALAWGDVGHSAITSMAARATQNDFFISRQVPLGYLANLPDTSWKNQTQKSKISPIDFPSHFLNPERLLGSPADLTSLPPDYSRVKELYEGKDSPLPDFKKKLSVYTDLGTAPWRVQSLHRLLIEAFRCAKEKESDPAQMTAWGYGPAPVVYGEPPAKVFECQKTRKSDLTAAVQIAGILAHYLEDLSQPLHISANYDGWVTGNGGIHSYFENKSVEALDPLAQARSANRVVDPKIRAAVLKRFKGTLDDPNGVASQMLQLAADSFRHFNKIISIDDKSVSEKGTALPLGKEPYEMPKGSIKPAKRDTKLGKKVLQSFQPIILERFETAAILLAEVWIHAWKKAGAPQLGDAGAMPLPFPHDSFFIWPDFDLEAIKKF